MPDRSPFGVCPANTTTPVKRPIFHGPLGGRITGVPLYMDGGKDGAFDLPFLLDDLRVEQGCVAQIVSHHDGWIQGSKIQRGDGNIVIPVISSTNQSCYL